MEVFTIILGVIALSLILNDLVLEDYRQTDDYKKWLNDK